MDSSSEGICVAIRIRPLNDREITASHDKAFRRISSNVIAQVNGDNQPVDGQNYYYDKIFDDESTTDDVYQYVAKDIVSNVVHGINGTIFAYGQTSSGKTFTMLGDGQHRGVLEMAAEDIFSNISQCFDRDFLIRVSFVEIYNEKIFDLLSDSIEPPNVIIREDPRKGVYCETTEIMITDYESILKSLRKGTGRRHVAETLMNEKSSRSHTIFRIVIESKANANTGNDVDGAVLVASLNLVDLAGSESVRLTGATGQRAKEGGRINQSLLSLSRVIQSLSQPGHHVSFRDSQLTRLLQPSLSGNAKMSIVCCITPADKYLEETKSTLQFASRAKLVKTHATVNEVVDESVQIRRLKKELEELKRKTRKSSEGSMSISSDNRIKFDSEKNELLERIENLENEKENHLKVLDRYREIVPIGQENESSHFSPMIKRLRSKRETWCPGDNKTTKSSTLNRNSTIHFTSASSNNTDVDVEDDKELLRSKIENMYTQLSFAMIAIKERDITIESLTNTRDDILQRFEIEAGASAECEKELRDQIIMLEDTIQSLREEMVTMNNHHTVLTSENIMQYQQLQNEVMIMKTSHYQQVDELKVALSEITLKYDDTILTLSQTNNQIESFAKEAMQSQSTIQAMEIMYEETITMKESLEQEVVYLKAEIESWNERYHDSMEKISSLQTKLDVEVDTQSYLDLAREETKRLENVMVEYQEKYEKDMSIYKNQVAILTSENETIAILSETNHSLMQQIQQLQDSYTTFDERYSMDTKSLSQCNEELSNTIQDLRIELEGYQIKATEFQEINDSIQSEYDMMQSELLNHRSKVLELENIISLKESELIEIKEQFSTINDTNTVTGSTKILELETELSTAEELIAGLESDIKNLTTELQESYTREEGLVNAVQESDTELQSLRDQISELEHQLEGAVEDCNNYQAKIQTLQTTIENTCNNNNTNTTSMNASYAMLEAKEVDNINEKMVLKQIIVELEEKVQSLQVMVSSTSQDNNSLNRTYETKLRELQMEVEQLSNHLGTKESEVTKLSKQVIELQAKITLSDQQLSNYYNQMNVASDDEQGLRKRVGQLQTTLDLVQSERDVLQRKLQESIAENKSLSYQIATMEESTNKKLQSIEKQLNSYNNLKAEHSSAVENIKVLQYTISDLRNQNHELNINLNGACKRIDELEVMTSMEVVGTKAMISDADTASTSTITLDKKDTKLIESEELVVELQSKLGEIQMRYNKLKDELQMYVSELKRSEDMTTKLKEENTILHSKLGEVIENMQQLQVDYDHVREKEEKKLLTTTPSTSLSSDDINQLEETIMNLKNQIILSNSIQAELTSENNDIKIRMNKMSTTIEQLNQTIKESMESQSIISSLPSRDENLMEEMNVLMETKLELESKLNEMESQLKEYITKLNDYDRSSAREQQMIMDAASREIDSLRLKYEAMIQSYSESQVIVEQLKNEISVKMIELGLKQDALTEAMNEIYTLKEEQKNVGESSNQAIEELKASYTELNIENKVILSELESKSKEISILKKDLSKANSEIASVRIEFDEAMEIKEKRITHLEASKLTKDQLEKIKVMKEERKKYMEECKTMKKQLAALKKSYDDLKVGNSSSNSSSSSSFNSTTAATTKHDVDIMELEEKYDMAQEVMKTLKEKLRECSKQLQVYETERSNVIEVLDKNGIDTSSLFPLDTSVSDDYSTYSLADQDLAGAVSKLAQKFMVETHPLSKRLKEVEETLAKTEFELEESKGLRSVLEKRVEAMKGNAKISREEYAKANDEIDLLTTRVEELTSELSQARQKVLSSSDTIHSEIQALEEENIEIMKENKELRKELSKLKVQLENRMNSTSSNSSSSNHNNNTVISDMKSERSGGSSSSDIISKKRSFGHEVAIPSTNIDTLNMDSANDSIAIDGSVKRRRVRNKVVNKNDNNVDNTAPGSAEAPGECVQS